MAQRFHIGMRKIKSILAIILSFFIWQLCRVFLPMLEVHPIFAYVYSIIEMRETLQKTKDMGKLRIRATAVGLVIGLAFVLCSVCIGPCIESELWSATVELAFILIAALCSLCIAELLQCKEFCGAAAIITVICIVSRSQDDVLLYAVMRAAQTAIGVFAAMLVNLLPARKREAEEK